MKEGLADRLATMQYSSGLVLSAMRRIAKDGEEISLAGARAAINGLFQQLELPSSYNADQLAASLRKIHELLR